MKDISIETSMKLYKNYIDSGSTHDDFVKLWHESKVEFVIPDLKKASLLATQKAGNQNKDIIQTLFFVLSIIVGIVLGYFYKWWAGLLFIFIFLPMLVNYFSSKDELFIINTLIKDNGLVAYLLEGVLIITKIDE